MLFNFWSFWTKCYLSRVDQTKFQKSWQIAKSPLAFTTNIKVWMWVLQCSFKHYAFKENWLTYFNHKLDGSDFNKQLDGSDGLNATAAIISYLVRIYSSVTDVEKSSAFLSQNNLKVAKLWMPLLSSFFIKSGFRLVVKHSSVTNVEKSLDFFQTFCFSLIFMFL